VDQVGRDRPVNDAQHLTHGLGVGGKQIAQGKGEADDPLAQWHIGKDLIGQQGGCLGHAAGAAARTGRPRKNPRFLQENANFRQVSSQTSPPVPTGLNTAATGPGTIQLSWTDTASDESGFRMERSKDGGSYTVIASLDANSTSYLDGSLTPDTLYNYRVRAWNCAGNSDYSNVATAATESAPPVTEQVASADLPVSSKVSGDYQNTWADDSVHETITERQGGNEDHGYYGYLEQKWVFNVTTGNALVFSADVAATTYYDSFTFAYSTDDSQYIDMFTFDSRNPGQREILLPPTVSGTVYIKVRDNVHSTTDDSSYSVNIDHLSIRSENGDALPRPTAPQSPVPLSAGGDSIDSAGTDTTDVEPGFDVDRPSNDSSQWQQPATAEANARSFGENSLNTEALYDFVLSALSSNGSSASSEPASARTEEQAAAPLGLQAPEYEHRASKMSACLFRRRQQPCLLLPQRPQNSRLSQQRWLLQ
jgi:hypothetical protein